MRKLLITLTVALAIGAAALPAVTGGGDGAGRSGTAVGATAIEYGLIAASDPAAPKRLNQGGTEQAGSEMATF